MKNKLSGIIVTSVTYAVMGKQILQRAGMKAYIEKLSPGTTGCGCGYGIRVRGDGGAAAAILERSKIAVKGFYDIETEEKTDYIDPGHE